MRQLGNKVRRGRGDHDGIGGAAGINMRHAVGDSVPLIDQHRATSQRLHRGRRDEVARCLGHRHLHFDTLLHQQARQLRRLVSGYPPGETEHNAFCLGFFHNVAHLTRK